MRRIKKYRHLITLNLIDKIKEFEANPPQITGFSISRLQYLIHLIISHKQDKHPIAYSLLNMGYMLNVVPRAGEYLNFLKEKGIIEWINHRAGRNSRLYRLVYEGKVEFRAITDKRLIYRIERNRRVIKKRNSKKYPVLNGYINQVQIDYEAAIKTIESTYLKNIEKAYAKAEGRRTFSLAEIDRIQSGEIYIKCNKTNGRLDSNYTRLPSELIQHLTIKGKPMVEIDIKNSQPFFAACVFNPTPEIKNLINRFFGHYFTIYIKSLQLAECEDFKLYASLVTNGNFYPFFMEKFKENGIEVRDRDELKKQLFIVFFGKNNACKYNPAARLFKFLFPNVQKLFDVIKKDNYNQLAILLQRIESYTILERVAKNIIEDLPGLPFLTRHDSILPSGIFVATDVDKVKEIMLSTIKEVTGLKPDVRIKCDTEKYLKELTKRPNHNYQIINSNLSLFNTSLPLCIPNLRN